MGVAVVSGYAQDDAQSQTGDQQQKTTQIQTYEFPSNKERFNRYISVQIRVSITNVLTNPPRRA